MQKSNMIGEIVILYPVDGVEFGERLVNVSRKLDNLIEMLEGVFWKSNVVCIFPDIG